MRAGSLPWRLMKRLHCWRYDHTWYKRKSDGKTICYWCLWGARREPVKHRG